MTVIYQFQRLSISSRRLLRAAPLVCAMALALPSAATAQEQGQASTDEIIVTAKGSDAADEARIKEIANEYVDTLTVVSQGQGLPRYEPDIYCPAVIGLSPDVNARIGARMRQVAEGAGVKPAAPDCRPSALVIFADDKDSFLKDFRKAHPVYFQSLKDRHWDLPKEDGPAIAWHLAQLLDENGRPVARDSQGRAWVSSYTHASRMRTMTESVMAMSVTIIERRALVGLTTMQIGDYAFMRSMTDSAPTTLEDLAAPTILTVLSTPMGEAAPKSLTQWDLAYVKARYDGDPRMEGHKSGTRIRAALREAAEDTPLEEIE